MQQTRPSQAVSLVVLLAAACGGEMVAPEPGPPVAIQRLRGDFQTAELKEDLRERLIVLVTDSARIGVPRVSVVWTMTGGGEVTPQAMLTDVGGKASTQVRLSRDAGDRIVTAALEDDPNVHTSFIVLVSAPSGGGGSPDVVVEVGETFFDPPLVSIKRGQIVQWLWVGTDPHNVVFMDTTITPRNSVGGTTIRRSGTWQHQFTNLGVFDYGCLVHGFPAQSGRVIVN